MYEIKSNMEKNIYNQFNYTWILQMNFLQLIIIIWQLRKVAWVTIFYKCGMRSSFLSTWKYGMRDTGTPFSISKLAGIRVLYPACKRDRENRFRFSLVEIFLTATWFGPSNGPDQLAVKLSLGNSNFRLKLPKIMILPQKFKFFF